MIRRHNYHETATASLASRHCAPPRRIPSFPSKIPPFLLSSRPPSPSSPPALLPLRGGCVGAVGAQERQRAGGSLLLEVHSHVLEIFLSKIPPSLCPLSPMRGVGVDSVGEQERHRAVRVLHTKGLDLSCRNWGFPPRRCMPSMRSLCPRSRLPSAQVAVSFVSSCPVLYLLVENQRHQMVLQIVLYDQINE
ncbi:unnamed protein product [Musa banksii]